MNQKQDVQGGKAFDYIIVGGGSAGCVLAARLSEDPANKVLLLEAGPKDNHLWLKLPVKFRDFMSGRYFNWGYFSESETHLGDRQIMVPRGKVLGGSSSINGMLYCRCHPSDYERWRQMGLAGWGHDDVLPYFKRSQNQPGGDPIYHGMGGPLTVSPGDRQTSAHKAYVAAGVACGHGASADHNGAAQEGFGPAEYTIREGRRASTSQAFLKPAIARVNLTVVTAAHATRVLFENRRACGIEYISGGARQIARAGREVIVCGGAYNSPQLLMLSGVGPADHLRQHGIDVEVDAPDVGANLQDHIHVSVAYNADADVDFNRQMRADNVALSALNWFFFKRGPLGGLPVACIAYIRTRAELAAPDIELLMNRVHPESQVWFPGFRKPKGGFLGCRVVLLHPESRGSVELRSNDPLTHPLIRHNHLSAPNDLVTMREGVRRALDVYAAQPLAGLTRGEIFPGEHIRSDDELDAYIRAQATTIYHPTSTCRMGIDDRAVVDGSLRVNGVDGLRVVDASVMPHVPGGHTNAPTIMIAEKAADMILGRTPLPPAELPVAPLAH